MAKVLAYGFFEEEETLIRYCAERLGLSVRRVLPEERDEAVFRLLAKPEIQKTVPGVDDPYGKLVLVAPDTKEQMYSLFHLLKEAAGLEIPNKAIVTPSNLSWSFGKLLSVIAEESRKTEEAVKRMKDAKKS
ncbi:MAG: DUF3783 domain-containing protein [Clostridia bacterium]|nr:DUF3783 domain-containing protein [Clostridia bacterium]